MGPRVGETPLKYFPPHPRKIFFSTDARKRQHLPVRRSASGEACEMLQLQTVLRLHGTARIVAAKDLSAPSPMSLLLEGTSFLDTFVQPR